MLADPEAVLDITTLDEAGDDSVALEPNEGVWLEPMGNELGSDSA